MNLALAERLALFVRNFEPSEIVVKAWGVEYWIANEPEYCSKYLVLNPGFRCSLHRHLRKKESFAVVDGELELEFCTPDKSTVVFDMRIGDRQLITPGTWHRFGSKTGAVILETSMFHSDSDVERLAESGPL